jgi:murein DD-endopeptidase MepM/ murein hydrolase activator NlpD
MRARTRAAALLALVLLCGVATSAAMAASGFGDRPLREGAEGADVEALQRKLNKLGFETPVDGVFGAETTRSVRRWERDHGRTVNGKCSMADAERIKRQVRRLSEAEPEPGAVEDPPAEREESGDTPTDTEEGDEPLPERAYGSRPLEKGDQGSDVARLQRLLTDQGLSTTVDGRFSRATKANVQRWEAWQYRRANGGVSRNEARTVLDLAKTGSQYEQREHVFPVRGPHDYGGAGSRFGAPRSGHTHQGHDVAAAEGTDLVAAHSGTVAARQYQASGAGHYLVIHGDDGLDSVYMHLRRRAIVEPGDRVRAGERIGDVGSTGASTGPHLHFELWTRHWFDGGHPFDPLRKLQRWDSQTP